MNTSLNNPFPLFLEENFCVTIDGDRGYFPYKMSQLCNQESGKDILLRQSEALESPPFPVVGSLFAKRFSVYCMATLASLSLFDKMLPIRTDLIQFRNMQEAQMSYAIDATQIRDVEPDHRDRVIKQFLSLFQTEVGSVIDVVTAYTGIRSKVMWALIIQNIQNLYIRLERLCKTSFSGRLPYLNSDLTVFQTLFEPYLSAKCQNGQTNQRLFTRSHCCLAFKLQSKHPYCNTCPKKTDN